MLYINCVLKTRFQYYKSVWILDILIFLRKKFKQYSFYTEIMSQKYYFNSHVSLDIKHPPLWKKYILIDVLQKSCLKNTILVLHISLDIKHPNLLRFIPLRQKSNSIHFQNRILEILFQLTYEFGYQTSTIKEKNTILFMLCRSRVLKKRFQFYISIWISNIKTFKVWISLQQKFIEFMLYEIMSQKHYFNSTYQFDDKNLNLKDFRYSQGKNSIIFILYRNRNIILVLYISLDI